VPVAPAALRVWQAAHSIWLKTAFPAAESPFAYPLGGAFVGEAAAGRSLFERDEPQPPIRTAHTSNSATTCIDRITASPAQPCLAARTAHQL
jgi:hypothetical protein